MSAPKMTRHDMKQDDLVTFVEKAGNYIQKNPTQVRNIGIASAAVVALAAIAYLLMSSRSAAAGGLMQEAQLRFSAPVTSSGVHPADLALSYATDAERDRAALESFDKLAQSYGGSSQGKLASYYQGVLLDRLGRSKEAEAALRKFIDSSPTPLLAALAQGQLAQSLARNGDLDGAAKIYTELAETKNGPYPRDWALYFLAETFTQQGKKAEAATTYQKIVTEFPASYFITEAKQRAKGA